MSYHEPLSSVYISQFLAASVHRLIEFKEILTTLRIDACQGSKLTLSWLMQVFEGDPLHYLILALCLLANYRTLA